MSDYSGARPVCFEKLGADGFVNYTAVDIAEDLLPGPTDTEIGEVEYRLVYLALQNEHSLALLSMEQRIEETALSIVEKLRAVQDDEQVRRISLKIVRMLNVINEFR